jgi:hypothetical protein
MKLSRFYFITLISLSMIISCDLENDEPSSPDLSEDFAFGGVSFDEYDGDYPSIIFWASSSDFNQSINFYFYCTDSSKTTPEPGNYEVVSWTEFDNGNAADWDVEIEISDYDGEHYYYLESKSGSLSVSDDGSDIILKDVLFEGIIDDPDGTYETIEDRIYSGTLNLSN